MKRIIFPLLVGILFLILQTTLLPSFPIQRIRPDILLILTLYLAFLFPPIFGGILAFFMGYLMDLFSGNAFGFYTFSRPLVFFAAQFFKERFYLEGFYSQFLFVFVFAMLEGILILILLNALQSLSSWKPLSLVIHFPPSPIVFHRSCHPTPLFPFSKGVVVIIPSTREGNEGEGVDHDGIEHPEDGRLQRKV